MQKRAILNLERLKKITLPPTHSLNISAGIKRILSELGPTAMVLDLGSGCRRLGNQVINLDVQSHPEVDVIATGARLPFKSESFDCVIVQAVLEHVPDAEKVIDEIMTVLKKGGYVYAEIPFIQPYHPDPEDYQRFTLKGINYLFRYFDCIDSGVCVGPTSALCGILKEYLPLLVDIPVIRGIVYRLVGYLAIPFKYLDLLLAKKRRAHIVASGLYFYGRRPLLSKKVNNLDDEV
jgi:SAM-dependent methyltransferase